MPETPLTLRLFGGFDARRAGVPVPGLHLREGERLLAYLTLRAGKPVASLELARRFWPADAQGSLDGHGDFPSVRQSLRSLRQALVSDAGRLTRPSRATVCLDLTAVQADVLDFDRLIRAGADAEAVALYRGPLLAGWPEPWAAEARAQYRLRYEHALRRLAEAARGGRQGGEAVRWFRLLLTSRPGDEEVARGLLCLLRVAGQYAEAFEIIERLEREAVAAGRSLEPKTVALAEELRHAFEAVLRTKGTPHGEDKGVPHGEDKTPTLGGAVPIGSPFYVERPADAQFHAALVRGDSVVLVKGARQVGKTSLLARGLQRAREAGARVVTNDFQKLNAEQLTSPDAFYRALAADIARQLGLAVSVREVWDEDFGPNMNMELFLRGYVLDAAPGRLVWGLDEVDRLFSCPFGSEVFGLFRSWHNERSLDPSSPLGRLTLAIAYATEAHLFIADPNQSPFNVGTRLALADFSPDEVADLNGRYGAPWGTQDLARLASLVGGQPYLVQIALDRATQSASVESVEAEALADDGLFGEHLRRLLLVVSRAPGQAAALRGMLSGGGLSQEDFYRLRAAGILSGPSSQEACFRCRLYEDYFSVHLGTA